MGIGTCVLSVPRGHVLECVVCVLCGLSQFSPRLYALV